MWVRLLYESRQFSIDAKEFSFCVPILVGSLPIEILIEIDGQRIGHNNILVSTIVEHSDITLIKDRSQPMSGSGEKIRDQIVIDVVDLREFLVPNVESSSDVGQGDKLYIDIKIQHIRLEDVVEIGIIRVHEEGIKDRIPVPLPTSCVNMLLGQQLENFHLSLSVNVHQSTLVRKFGVIHHVDGVGEGISQSDSLQIDFKLSFSFATVEFHILLVDLVGNPWDVLSRKGLASDEEGTLAVFGKDIQKLNKSEVKMITGRLNCLGVSIGVRVAESCAHRVVDENDRVVLVPTPGVFWAEI